MSIYLNKTCKMTLSITQDEITEIDNSISDDQVEGDECFVIFLGHAHSGHSIVGALLDAHPDIAISNELNVPKLILDHDLDNKVLQKIILYYSLNHSSWINTGYKYNVPESYQGKTKFPKILGDKKGGGSTRIIRNNPWVLDKLVEMFGKKLRFINVIREPKDNIAAFAHYWGDAEVGRKHVDRYFENYETNKQIEKKFQGAFYKLKHSDFIKNPVYEFKKILQFLNLKANENQLKSWLSIVRNTENNRSETINWSKNIRNAIKYKKNQLGMTEN